MSTIEAVVSAAHSFIELGGPVVAILVAVSVISLAVIVWKLFQFWQARIGSRGRSEAAIRLWRAGRNREALDHARQGRSPSARAVAQAIALASENKRSKLEIEERLTRHVTANLHELQSGFRLLDAVAQLSPLLGLFGTVLGMIEAFRQLQSAGNAVDPSLLAGGIWVALLTTAAGLAVAMPVSVVLTWLETRLEDERVAIETLTADVLLGGASSLADTEVVEAAGGEVALAH